MDKKKIKLKQDKFRKTRGGCSKLLEIRCEKCDELVCHYQKDGPGSLKRMYMDRIISTHADADKRLICHKCGNVLGLQYIYEKENRPAFRLLRGSVKKKIVKE